MVFKKRNLILLVIILLGFTCGVTYAYFGTDIIKDKINPIYHNAQLRYVTIPSLTDPTNATSVNIDASVKNAVVLIREGSGFVVVNGLSVRKKIHFNDYDITVSSPEPIKRDYDFYEEEQLRRERYRN